MFSLLKQVLATRETARQSKRRDGIGSRRNRLGLGLEVLEERTVLSAFGASIYTQSVGNQDEIVIQGGGYAHSGDVWNDAKVWIDQNGLGIADDQVVVELKTSFIEPLFHQKVTVTQTEKFKLYQTAGERFVDYNIKAVHFLGRGGDDSFENQTYLTSYADGNFLDHTHADNDLFIGGSGAEYFYGMGGEDTIHGNGGDDYLYGGRAADLLFGEAGNDFIVGDDLTDMVGHGKDSIWGGDGDDDLLGNGGRDWISGGADNDLIRGQADTDVLYGDDGEDTIFGGLGSDHIEGGDDDDVLLGGNIGFSFICRVDGGKADDSVDFMYGGNGNDLMYGDDGNDAMLGESGFDILVGGYGNDILSGGSDADLLFGGYHSNLMQGEFYVERGYVLSDSDAEGNDTLYGGSGLDQLYGMSGDDYLDGGHDGQADLMQGGLGDDRFKMYYDVVARGDFFFFLYEVEDIVDFNQNGNDTIVH